MKVTPADRRQLEAIVGDRNAPQKYVWRAKIILATADGWFRQRVQLNGGRVRKVLIVALARKLLIAFWKYVTAGVVLEGAETAAA